MNDAVSVGFDCCLLRFEAEARLALALSGNSEVGDVGGHDYASAFFAA
jgi:hypothetical protein